MISESNTELSTDGLHTSMSVFETGAKINSSARLPVKLTHVHSEHDIRPSQKQEASSESTD